MSSKYLIATILLLISFGFLSAQAQKPLLANDVLQTAFNEAKSSDKNIFLIFHASWCGWCKRLEKAIQSPELKKIFEDNFVITRLDVLERNEKVGELENPGGREIMAKYGGEKSGLPFFVFVDSTGKKLADSNVMPKNQNIGYPGVPEEIEAFAKIVKISAKNMSGEQLAAIINYFRTNAPKSASH